MTSDNQPPVTKRVRYFNGQFLKSQDFIDEQKYHNDRQRRPYPFLHVSGICDGLTVAKDNTNPQQVTVAPGTALDTQGRLIVLDQSQAVDIQNKAGKTVNIYISYAEEPSDITQQGNDESGDGSIEGVKGATRWWEKPKIEVVEGDKQNVILLATVTLDANGNVLSVNQEQRQYSGVRLPSGDGIELVLRSGGNGGGALLSGSLTVSGKLKVLGLGSSEQLVSIISNDDVSLELRSTINNGEAYYELADGNNGASNSWKLGTNNDGKLHFAYGAVGTINSQEKMTILTNGNVGIGTTSPGAKLDVQGIIRTYNKDNSSATQDNIQIWSDGSSGYIQSNGDENGLKIKSNTGGKIILESNVGIGTSSSRANLEVSSTLKLQSGVAVNEFSTNTSLGTSDTAVPTQKAVKTYADTNKALLGGAYTQDFSVKTLKVADKVGIGITTPSANAAPKIHLAIGDDDTGLQQISDGELAIYTDNVERVRIAKNGNVGIGTGTTVPAANLEVKGNLKLQSGVAVNEFSIDGTLGGNSDSAVPTEKAVRSYADTKAPKNGDSAQDFRVKKLTVADTVVTNKIYFPSGHEGDFYIEMVKSAANLYCISLGVKYSSQPEKQLLKLEAMRYYTDNWKTRLSMFNYSTWDVVYGSL